MDVAEVVLVGGLAAIALWQRHIILYVGSFVGLLLYGLQVADSDIKLGIPFVLFSVYFLYRTVAQLLER